MSLSPRKCAERLHDLGGSPAGFDHFLESAGSAGIPVPGILERIDL
jgi:hypothetical protein